MGQRDVCARCQGERWICEAHPDRPWPHYEVSGETGAALFEQRLRQFPLALLRRRTVGVGTTGHLSESQQPTHHQNHRRRLWHRLEIPVAKVCRVNRS